MKQLIRQAQKIDTYNNWEINGSNVIPLPGEIIVYQGGEGDYKNEPTRFKIGDGNKSASELPFIIPEAIEMTENGIQTSQIEAESVNAQTVTGQGFSISQDQAYINNDPTGGELITREALNTWWINDSGDGTPAQKEIEWNNVQSKPSIYKGAGGDHPLVTGYQSEDDLNKFHFGSKYYKNASTNNASFAGGSQALSKGKSSFAYGRRVQALTDRDIAMGHVVTAGYDGTNILPAGDYQPVSVAIGDHLVAYEGQQVHGKYNSPINSFSNNGSTFTPLYIIGAGTSDAELKNAFIIDTGGNTHIINNLYLNGAISGANFSDITLDNGLSDIIFEPSITINDKQVNTLAAWAFEYANSYKNIDNDLKEELKGTVDSYIINQVW